MVMKSEDYTEWLKNQVKKTRGRRRLVGDRCWVQGRRGGDREDREQEADQRISDCRLHNLGREDLSRPSDQIL